MTIIANSINSESCLALTKLKAKHSPVDFGCQLNFPPSVLKVHAIYSHASFIASSKTILLNFQTADNTFREQGW